ncbi:BQ5605_C039g11808 [Microbotryum silenes-dioicae]|uniref:BQ5605_C039g11808 protein n=1 Tax=Microbotryum silenes-dioicae TaxID=796604 RepID=A0A2X0MEX4_9BASI|nr:BQ5605_C039g11808 [Microbotryum silenes-dioicae]
MQPGLYLWAIQKQILLGDAATGKSSLLVRLTDDRFLNHSEPTIGVEFGSRLVELTEGEDKGKKVKLQIWDTAGQVRSYYRGAGGALLCFDLTSRSTFLSCQSWLTDLKQWGEEDLLVLVVGNKKDLIRSPRRRRRSSRDEVVEEEEEVEEGRSGSEEGSLMVVGEGIEGEVEEEDGERRIVPGGGGDDVGGVEELRKEVQAWVEEQGLAGYVETSAKDGEGVQEAFNELTRKVHEKHQKALSAQRARGGSNGSKGFRLTRGGGASTTNEGGGGCC